MKKSFITVALALFVSFFITFTFACSTTVEEPAPEEAKTEQQEEKKTESPASNGGTSGGTSQGGGSNPTGGQNGGGQTPQTPQTPQPPAPVINYTVTFMSNCETATGTTNSITAAENTNITLTANGFIREGYTFTGWNTSADGTGTGYAESSTIKLTGNLILYAQWILATVPTYSVTINEVEHGTVAVSQAVAEAGTQISITVTPDELYAFNTINLTAADETVITPVVDSENANQYTFTMPQQNVTLSVTFVYIAHSITVSSVENGTVTVNKTAAVAGSEISVTLAPNSEYMLNSIAVTSGNGNAITTTVNTSNSNLYTFSMPDENVTVMVTYKLTPYTVTFVTDCSVQVPPQTVERNAKATAVTMSNNSECYSFRGWYTEPECENQFNFNNEITGNIKLYAKWGTFILDDNRVAETIKNLNYSCSIDTSVNDATIVEINKALKELYKKNSAIWISLYISVSKLENADSTHPYNSFYGCQNLTYITLHDIDIIGDSAFEGCTSLKGITFFGCDRDSAHINSIGGRAFFNCPKLESIFYVGSPKEWCNIVFGGKIIDKVSNKFYFQFLYGRRLEGNFSFTDNIFYPEAPVTIPDYAFAGLITKDTSITIDNTTTSIGNNAFADCQGLSSLDLGNNLSSIGDYALKNCKKLKNITIPSSVQSIGIGAFSGCSSLEEMTIPFIGANAIGPSPRESGAGTEKTVFGYIFGTDSYEGGDFIKQYYEPYYGGTDIHYIKYCIPSSLIKVTVTGGQLYYGSFDKCKNIKQIILENGVNAEDGINYAFSGCLNLEYCRLPDGMQILGANLFYNCPKLSEVRIPNSINRIAKEAFRETGFTSFEIPDTVTILRSGVFSGCTNLTRVVIPASVTDIQSSAFKDCPNLNEAVFRDTTSSWKKGSEDIGPMSSVDTYSNAQLLKSIVDEKVNLKKITN